MSTLKTTRYLLFAVTIAIAAMALLFLSQQAQAGDYDFSMSVSQGSQSGEPEDIQEYPITVINDGDVKQVIALEIDDTSVPTGWEAWLSKAQTKELRNDGDDLITLYVEIGVWADAGDKAFVIVNAESKEDANITGSVQTTTTTSQKYKPRAAAQDPTAQDVEAGETVDFTVTVSNIGNGEDTITITIPEKDDDDYDGWIFVKPNSVTLARNETTNITLRITPVSTATAGQYGVTVKVCSDDGGLTCYTDQVIATVIHTPNLEVFPSGGKNKDIEAGKSEVYSIELTNKGNDYDDFNITVVPGDWQADGWTATVEPSSVTDLGPNDPLILSEVLTVEAPEDASADDKGRIPIKVCSEADPTKCKTVTTTSTVTQEFEPSLLIIGEDTKNVEPEEEVTFDINITNDGNGEDKITLTLIGGNASWASFSGQSSFTLQRDTTGSTIVRVSPPKGTTQANNYQIIIKATSEDGTTIDTKPIFVNVDQVFDVSATVKSGESSLQYADPDTTIEWNITITNKGNGEDTFRLTLEGAKADWGSIQDQIDLVKDEAKDVILLVNVPEEAVLGDYKIYILATSDEDPTNATGNTSVTISVNQKYDIGVTIIPSSKEADPDTFVNYTVEIANKGTGEDTFDLTVDEKPAGWFVQIDPNQVTLDPAETTVVNLSIKVAEDADNIEYYVNISATSDGDGSVSIIGSTITMVNQHYEFTMVSSLTYKKMDPDSSTTIDLTLDNKGTGDDTIELEAETPAGTEGWVADVAPSVDVAEGQSEMVTLSITVPDEEVKGTYYLTVTATSADFPEETHTLDIQIDVTQLYDVGLVINLYQKSVDPGANVVYDLIVQNKGTGTDTIELDFNTDELPPGGWQANFNRSEVDVPAGDVALVNFTIEVDEDADNLIYSLNVTAASNEEDNATATRETLTSVNQRYELSLISEMTYKKADPEEAFTVDITIENKGTGDDTVDMVVTPPVNTTGWITDIAPSVDVPEEDTSITTLTITVSDDAVKQSYVIIITGTSHDDPNSVATAEITVDVTQRFEVQMLPRTETKSADPGENITFDITVVNKGTGQDTFDIVLGGEVGVDWGSLDQVSVTLEAGEQTTVVLTVDVDKDAEPKPDYEIIINITSVEDDSEFKANDTVQRYIDVQASVGLSASHVTEFQTVDPSPTQARSVNFAFTVTNDGTKDDKFKLELLSSQYNKWISQALQSDVTVVAGETSSNINFAFSIPGYTNDDDVVPADIIFTVDITSDEDETVTTSLDFTLTIEEVLDVTINADTTTVSVEPGKVAAFDVKVKNDGNERDTIALSIPTDTREWATFEATGSDTHEVTVNATEEQSVRVLVSLPAYDNATGADKTTLEGSSYQISVKALTSDGLAQDTQSLTTSILDIFGAELTISGDNTVITYPSTESAAGDRQEKFTLKLKNQGNRGDQIHLNVLATSYPNEWDVGIYTNTACTTAYTDTTTTSAGSTRTLYICATPDQDSDPGNVTLIIEASADDGKEDAVTTNAILDVREPARQFTVLTDENEITLAPEDGDSIASTAKFKIVITNDGTHDDNFIAQLDTSLSNDWDSPTGTNDDYFFTSNSGSQTHRWNANGETIEKEGGTDELWFIVVATEEVDTDNYTLRVTVKDADEKGTPQTITLRINIEAPERKLELTILDNEEELTPEYEGSDTVNRVKFKVKLENTGTHMDKYIPEVESTLENEDWEVEFYEDSGHSQKWPTNGVDIDKKETDDLWVFVIVDDESEEGLYPITISVRDEEDEPDARKEVELIVNITRPDLIVNNDDIALEINGAEAEPDTLKDGDSLKVVIDIENSGLADADDALVEVYLYPKIAPDPEDFDAITALENAGFDFDESKNNYLYFLESTTSNFRAKQIKQIVSDDWIVEGGEWYVEVRVDFDEDDDKGTIIEILETNNDARFPELLQIRPDLSIIAMRVDNKYITKAPNVDDVVTFTVTVRNNGAADVDGARLYIWNDNAPPDDMLRERTGNKDYFIFDVAALDEKTVRFKWEAQVGEWTGFRAEVNPKCNDIGEGNDPDCDDLTGRYIDELDRYNNNEFPAGGAEFKQEVSGANVTVTFLIWPDFIIKEIDLDPSRPERDGDDVTIKVTIENIGAADWSTGMGTLKLLVEDGEDYEEEMSITKAIDADDEEEFELKKKWETPDVKNVELTFELDYDGGKEYDELDDSNNKYEDEEGNDYFELELKEKGGGIAGTGDLDPIVFVLIGLVVLMALMIPIMFKAGKKKGGGGEPDLPPGAAAGAAAGAAGGAAAGGAAAAAGAPTKMSVMIQSPDGKVAKPKMPPSMPVSKLLEICIQKFELADKGEFELKAGDEVLQSDKTLTDAGVKEGDKILVVAKGGDAPEGGAPAAPAAPAAPEAPPATPPENK